MKSFNLLAFLGILLSCASCSRVFAPAMYLHEETYMQKPFLDSAETHKQSVYLSLKGGSTTQSVSDYDSPDIFCGLLQAHQAHSFRAFNLSYGVQAALGNANIPTPQYYNNVAQYNPSEAGNKFFQGLGARIEVNLKAPSSNPYFEWRALGVSYSHSVEFGDYYAFRQRLMPAARLAYSRGNQMFSLGLNTEFCWRLGQHNPANRGYAINFKLGYLYSKFPNFVDVTPQSPNDPKLTRHDRENNVTFVVVGDFHDFQLIYQTISPIKAPLPILAGVSHSLQVGLNLSAFKKKSK